MRLIACLLLTTLAVGCKQPPKPVAGPVIRHLVRDDTPLPKIEIEEPPPATDTLIVPEFADEQPAEIGRRHPIIRPRPGPFREEPSPVAQPPEDDVLKSMTKQELAELIEELQNQRERERPEPPQKSERETMLENSGLWFDTAAFEANMPKGDWQTAEPGRRVRLVFLKVSGCPPCVKQNKEFAPLREAGWVQDSNEDAHIRELLIDETDAHGWAAKYEAEEFPVVLLEVDGNVAKRWDNFVTRKVVVEEFTKAVDNLKPLMKAAKPPPFSAGEKQITKEQMDILMNLLGKSGPLVLPNSDILIDQQGITFKIPAGVKATNTVTGSLRRLVFDAASKPSAKYSSFISVSASADAIVLDVANYTVTAEMPGLIPDPVIKLLKE